MKKFILQITIFLILAVSCFIFILSRADGYTDGFYLRFTTPKQESLIIGTSRAAQGLQPQVFKDSGGLNIYNYAFTALHSPYGNVYLNSIKKKVRKGTGKGTFILTVDPWCISGDAKNPNDTSLFKEYQLILANTPHVDKKPNFGYLFNNLGGKYYEVFAGKIKPSTFLHDDGWLEIFIAMDKSSVEKRTKTKIKEYRTNNLPSNKFSEVRFNYLKKTIEFLGHYGNVYLVRLPVHSGIMEIENELMPDFNEKIASAVKLSDGFLDMTPRNNEFTYIDGNHLYKESGKIVSKEIVNWIKNIQ